MASIEAYHKARSCEAIVAAIEAAGTLLDFWRQRALALETRVRALELELAELRRKDDGGAKVDSQGDQEAGCPTGNRKAPRSDQG